MELPLGISALPGQTGASGTDIGHASSSLDNRSQAAAALAHSANAAADSHSVVKSASELPTSVAAVAVPIQNASSRTIQRKAITIKPLPQAAASPKAPVSVPAIPRYSQPQIETDFGSATMPPRSQVRRASTFLNRTSTPSAPLQPAASFAASMTPVLDSSASLGANIVQLQLSLRNLKGSDLLSPAHPLAILSCSADAGQGGALSWTELGRTECRASSMNPSFHQKIIVWLPKLEAVDNHDHMMRVDVYHVHNAAAAGFEPSALTARSSYLGGVCFSTRSIVESLPTDEDSFFDNVSLFFQIVRSNTATSSILPPIHMQTPQEFNVMLAATPTPFCILTCSPVASNKPALEQYSDVPMRSKYPRSSADDCATPSSSLLSTLDYRDALVINQSISAYSYSFSSSFAAFARAHCAGRMLLMSDWVALKVTILELVQLARERPTQFYALSADGQQPISVMFSCCLYSLAEQRKARGGSIDEMDFPDVFTVISALAEGIANKALTISAAEAAAFQVRYSADSLEVAVQRELQMLLSRPLAATDASYSPSFASQSS